MFEVFIYYKSYYVFSSQALEDVSKNLGYAKTMLFGSAEQEAQSDYQLASLAQEMYNTNLLFLLISNLSKIDFEVRLGLCSFCSLAGHETHDMK